MSDGGLALYGLRQYCHCPVVGLVKLVGLAAFVGLMGGLDVWDLRLLLLPLPLLLRLTPPPLLRLLLLLRRTFGEAVPLVGGMVALLDERLRADRAAVRPLPGVDPGMYCQLVWPLEALPALPTLFWTSEIGHSMVFTPQSKPCCRPL